MELEYYAQDYIKKHKLCNCEANQPIDFVLYYHIIFVDFATVKQKECNDLFVERLYLE